MYGSESALQNVNYAAAQSDRPPSPLGEAIQRIQLLTDQAHQQAAMMNDQANRLFGSVPEGSAGEKPPPVPSGAVGELLEAIRRLESAQSGLGQACIRNCGLA